jgi:hypothetical protein
MDRTPPPPSDAERKRRARRELVALTRLMDSAVEVPWLRTSVGLDALLGLAPVVGDLVSAGIGLYLVRQARVLGASRWLQARMVGNLIADAALGAVPIAGDIADVYFKAHRRNLRLLQQALGEPFLEGNAEVVAGDVLAGEVIERDVIDAGRATAGAASGGSGRGGGKR